LGPFGGDVNTLEAGPKRFVTVSVVDLVQSFAVIARCPV